MGLWWLLLSLLLCLGIVELVLTGVVEVVSAIVLVVAVV